MSLINLVPMVRLPLGKHLELTLKATRSVFARIVFARRVLEMHVHASTCGLERELKDAAST
jgi:hypothetical protein